MSLCRKHYEETEGRGLGVQKGCSVCNVEKLTRRMMDRIIELEREVNLLRHPGRTAEQAMASELSREDWEVYQKIINSNTEELK